MTQIIIAGILSFLVAIFTTPMLVRYFSGVGKGQEIREDGPQLHLRKRGTPTMGGLVILGSVALYFLELLIMYLQAFVFTLLTAIYIQGAIDANDH